MEHLEWDSSFFNINIAREDVQNNKDFSTILNDITESQYDLIYLYSEEPLINLTSIDERVEFKKEIDFSENKDVDDIIVWEGGINSELIALAVKSGHKSRFNKDPKLNSKFRDLYTLWMEKSIDGRMADYVLVSLDKNIIDGMLTLKIGTDFSEIGLVAVDKEGKGIGNKLLQKAFYLSKKNNKKYIKVVTQKDNVGGMNYYLKNGFEIDKVNYIYHYWVK